MSWFDTWFWWVLLGIAAFFITLFFISCAVLNRCLDRHDDDRDWWR